MENRGAFTDVPFCHIPALSFEESQFLATPEEEISTIFTERKMNDNDFYPTIGITAEARIVEVPTKGWHWEVKVHVAGPDCVGNRQSELFPSKRDATTDLIVHFGAAVKEAFEELEP